MPRQSTRTARIEARLAPETLEIVKRAAELQGRSLSDFVVSAAEQVAHKTIEETTIIRLSAEGQRQIAEAIISPPEPPPELLRSVEAYRRLIRESR
jgi:uncharacterized protein (DUF1778 family)